MGFQKFDSGIKKARFQLHIAIQQQQIITFTIQPAELVADTAAAIAALSRHTTITSLPNASSRVLSVERLSATII
jgi:hypothetical protein